MTLGISGGMSGMGSMDAMRQMQQRMFKQTDADASGGIDTTEFESMLKNSPMGGAASGGAGSAEAFKTIDKDGNGELSQTEMEGAQTQMMERFQSTMQAFGQGSNESSQQTYDPLDTLLQAVGDKYGRADGDRRGADGNSDLLAQLRALADKVSSTYSSGTADSGAKVLVTA